MPKDHGKSCNCRGTLGYPGVPRGTPGYPGISPGTQGYPGVPRGILGYPRVPRGTPGRGTPGYPKVPQGTGPGPGGPWPPALPPKIFYWGWALGPMLKLSLGLLSPCSIGTQGSPGYPGVPLGSPGFPGVLRGSPGPKNVIKTEGKFLKSTKYKEKYHLLPREVSRSRRSPSDGMGC